jgi:hypothetical protein
MGAPNYVKNLLHGKIPNFSLLNKNIQQLQGWIDKTNRTVADYEERRDSTDEEVRLGRTFSQTNRLKRSDSKAFYRLPA